MNGKVTPIWDEHLRCAGLSYLWITFLSFYTGSSYLVHRVVNDHKIYDWVQFLH